MTLHITNAHMNFYDQLSEGERVEIDTPIGGIANLGMSGERGTIVDKKKGNWLDPVSQYLVEMDYPCSEATSWISGRHLRKLSPAEEEQAIHKGFETGAVIVARIANLCSVSDAITSPGILLPDTGQQVSLVELKGVIMERRNGARRNEPDHYLIKWDSGEISWCLESTISLAPQEKKNTSSRID